MEKTRASVSQGAAVIIGDPDAAAIRVHGLIASSKAWDELRATLGGVIAHYPGREFFAPPVWPEEFGTEVFEPLGFQREPLTQFLMRRDL